jgi:Spy/CpxP family protein refolding chaperone
MKITHCKNLILIAVLMLLSLTSARAQRLDERPPKENFRPQQILRELNLSKEQMQQIRRIHEEKREQMETAQMRLRDANRSLDRAIYADAVNESEIETRMKELVEAQGEVIKIRNMTELAVRKVLTQEQLARFREVREKFIKRMEERRMNDDEMPPQERDDAQNPPGNRPFQERRKNRIN